MRVCEFVIVSTRVSVTRASTHSPTYPPTYTQYQNFVIRSASEHRDILVKFVKSVELLKPLGGEQLIALSRAFQQKVFAAGETVIEQGTRAPKRAATYTNRHIYTYLPPCAFQLVLSLPPSLSPPQRAQTHTGQKGDCFYLIYNGESICKRVHEDGTEEHLATLKKSDYFGEKALLNDSPRAASIVATSQLECYVLGKDEFDDIIGPLKQELEKRSHMRNIRSHLPHFNGETWDEDHLEQFLNACEAITCTKVSSTKLGRDLGQRQ